MIYCIINLNNIIHSRHHGNFFLHERQRPTLLYESKDKAEAELLRLTEKHGEGFYLFEGIETGVKSAVISNVIHVEVIDDMPF